MQSLIFYLLGFGAIISALLMVTNKKPVNAAMSLILTMFLLSGIYVLLDAHLIAALQIIVYAGAIMVLFLFVIMLLNIQEKEGRLTFNKMIIQFTGIAVLGGIFVFIANLVSVNDSIVKVGDMVEGFGTTKAVGGLLFTDFILPFEVASILLLAAIVGAVILAKRRIGDSDSK